MAIVEMTKISLIGLSYHKERILNALHKVGCVEVIATDELDDTFVKTENTEREMLEKKYARANFCVEFFIEHIEKSKGKEYYPKNIDEALDNFFVSYDEFMSASGNEVELSYIVDKLEDYSKRLLNNKTRKLKLQNQKALLEPYRNFDGVFSDYKDTDTTKVFLGLIRQENIKVLEEFLKDYPLTALSVHTTNVQSVISVVSFNDEADAVLQKLNELGFSKCTFDYEMTALQKLDEVDGAILAGDNYDEVISKKVCGKSGSLRDLKILTDYYKFQLEKIDTSDNFRCTDTTFVLKGYLPKEKETEVKNAIYNVTNAVFISFDKPTEEDNPPTLLKNNPIIRQTEFITEMYSMPNYREFDPSRIVFYFFMLFMGLIMADIGYGIVMMAVGLFLSSRIKVDNNSKRLWNIIAIGGVFTILFGFLFNSLFGFTLLPFTLLPSPVPTPDSGTDGLMTILLMCLAFGVLQMMVGYLCKAINCFKNKDILGGIFDGLVWTVFFIGFFFAVFNFIIEYLMPTKDMSGGIYEFFGTMQMPGLYTAIGAVVIAMLTAGRSEKGFGKFSKGFGAVYGLINIMSDILSYARLFGLLLSGMIIASTFNDMGIGLLDGGGIGYVFGPLVMVVGHIFNLAMGVLGAYIHDSRLQYIEFFSKFYTGEGEKFTPLGSTFNYIYLTRN